MYFRRVKRESQWSPRKKATKRPKEQSTIIVGFHASIFQRKKLPPAGETEDEKRRQKGRPRQNGAQKEMGTKDLAPSGRSLAVLFAKPHVHGGNLGSGGVTLGIEVPGTAFQDTRVQAATVLVGRGSWPSPCLHAAHPARGKKTPPRLGRGDFGGLSKSATGETAGVPLPAGRASAARLSEEW